MVIGEHVVKTSDKGNHYITGIRLPSDKIHVKTVGITNNNETILHVKVVLHMLYGIPSTPSSAGFDEIRVVTIDRLDARNGTCNETETLFKGCENVTFAKVKRRKRNVEICD